MFVILNPQTDFDFACFRKSGSVKDRFKAGRRKGVQLNTHTRFTVFTHQDDRFVLDTLDNIDGSLSLVPEPLAYGNERGFLFYAG